MPLTIEPLSDVLGARITGVDLSQPLDAATFARIERALHDHGVIAFPRQRMSPETFVAFSRLWGRAEPHVIDTFHHPLDPNILVLSNVMRNGKPIGLLDGGTYFHSDYSYLQVPARCTMLYALQVPKAPAGTRFANQRLAWQALPQARRDAIDAMVCRHHYGNRNDLDESSRTVASLLNDEQKKKVSWVSHPLVRAHPYTGHKALYAVSGSSFGIEGLPDDEGRALLDELAAHATADRFCHTYEYQVHDLVVWDNVQMLHSAPVTDLREPRTLWRITVKEPH